MLRLLFVRTSEQIACRARIPEVSAKKGGLRCVVIEYREIRRISISLRGPFTRPILKGSGIRDHGQIDGWDRSAKSRVRHVTKTAGSILKGRHLLIEIHEL